MLYFHIQVLDSSEPTPGVFHNSPGIGNCRWMDFVSPGVESFCGLLWSWLSTLWDLIKEGCSGFRHRPFSDVASKNLNCFSFLRSCWFTNWMATTHSLVSQYLSPFGFPWSLWWQPHLDRREETTVCTSISETLTYICVGVCVALIYEKMSLRVLIKEFAWES